MTAVHDKTVPHEQRLFHISAHTSPTCVESHSETHMNTPIVIDCDSESRVHIRKPAPSNGP